jgi:hypothetical protein
LKKVIESYEESTSNWSHDYLDYRVFDDPGSHGCCFGGGTDATSIFRTGRHAFAGNEFDLRSRLVEKKGGKEVTERRRGGSKGRLENDSRRPFLLCDHDEVEYMNRTRVSAVFIAGRTAGSEVFCYRACLDKRSSRIENKIHFYKGEFMSLD